MFKWQEPHLDPAFRLFVMIFALCTDTIIIPGINLKHLSISLSSYQRRYVDTKRTIFGTALGWKGLNDKGDPDILINRDPDYDLLY